VFNQFICAINVPKIQRIEMQIIDRFNITRICNKSERMGRTVLGKNQEPRVKTDIEELD